jgi:ParB-like chromosome segregation protein Spo0J
MDLPPLSTDLYDHLREDVRRRGIQIPVLVDNSSGEVIDGKLRQQIAAELGIKNIPTIFVGRLTPEERDDLRLAVNVYRRHLTRAQMRELIAWMLRSDPEASDRCIAGRTGASHPTVARVRGGLEAGGTIYHLPSRNGQDGKHYPAAAKPAAFACTASEGRRARALLDRLGDDAPPRTASIRVLHKLANRKQRETLQNGTVARLPAHIKIKCCDFRDLAVPDGSVDLIFTDLPWGRHGRRLVPEFAAWCARKLRPDGGLLLLTPAMTTRRLWAVFPEFLTESVSLAGLESVVYPGHAGLLEVGSELARRLTYVWTLSCANGARGTHTQHDQGIRSCWRRLLLFCRGKYRAGKVFDDAIVSHDRDKTYHAHQ